LVSITRCHSSGLVLVTVLPAKMPALFTITCSAPNSRTVASTAASTWRSFETSATRARVRSAGSVFATLPMLPRWWPTSTTTAPSIEKRRAAASPIPEPAPVTITTLPSNRIRPPS